MVITPDSKVKLIKNPLKLDNNNELMFANATSQYNYFTSLPKLEFDSLTYVRKDGVLRIETDDDLTYEDLLEYNFCMYQNTHFDNKWFYAFITDITWVNPSLVDIKIETAYFQTWQFDLVYKDSFIEREHVNDDTIGLHTLDENLDTGDYIVDFKKSLTDLTAYKFILAVLVDYYIDGNNQVVISGGSNGGAIYNGLKTAYKYYYFNNGSVSKLNQVIQAYADAGKSEMIGMIFTAPTLLISKVDSTVTDDGLVQENYAENTFNWENSVDSSCLIYKPFSLNGYTPKNNKLLCYPYQYLLMSNNNGGKAIYKYELFETDVSDNHLLKFQVKSAICPSMSGVLVPYLYNRCLGFNYEESLQLPKFPICGWNSDVYTNWLTQQGVNNVVSLAKSGMAGATGGFMTGGIVGGITGAVLGELGSTTNIIQQMKNHEFYPAQANGNVNTGDVSLASNMTTFTGYGMCVKYEYAKMIDDYLSMFGYKVNRVGTPHLHVRTYYDYIKTVSANIEGDVPEPDLNQIRNMFNNGIRFWHDTTKYLDFSVNNTIIS